MSPPLAGSTTPDTSKTVEVRAVIPVPETLTLHAPYDPKTGSALVSGDLTEAGSPVAGATVHLTSATGDGAHTDIGPLTTDATGSFLTRQRVDRTTQFGAGVDETARPCSTPSTAPGGCVSETVSPPDDASAVAIVPRKTDPRLAIRPRDQGIARRSVLAAGDFPAGWLTVGDPPGPCVAFAPELRKLTASGQAFSPVFGSPDGTAFALSTTSVFVARADATTAFSREARVGAARCLAAGQVAGSSEVVAGVGLLGVPRIGDTSRAFRAVVETTFGQINIDIVFVRVGRAVIELDVYALGASEVGLEAQLGQSLAARARRQ